MPVHEPTAEIPACSARASPATRRRRPPSRCRSAERVRALDPRLLRRARAARVLLGVDAALGIATALVVLVQGTAIAWVVARSFDGDDAVTSGLVVLALAFAARAALAWLFEVAGNRAATSVLSELRLALVERRLRTQPAALDGTEGAALATAAVQGVDGLTAYFARYLPQVVLACAVPAAVLVYVATIDLTSAAIMLATLPLVPVFMWLIGRYTEARTRERWETLQLLSTHFLDVVRGLPTLRAFNRAATQRAVVAQLSDRYRQATMQTLRVGFLSGSVLELAATLGVALVAVTIGVRLVDGGLGLQAGADGARAGARAVPPAAPAGRAVPRQRRRSRRRGADPRAARRSRRGCVGRRARAAESRRRPARSRAGVVRVPRAARARAQRPRSGGAARRDGRASSARAAPARPRSQPCCYGWRSRPRAASASAATTSRTSTRAPGAGGSPGCRSTRRSFAARSPTTCGSAGRGRARKRVRVAAALAGADAFVAALPSGYDTVVGDGGRPLSAGERRRLALARAFLQDAPLLDSRRADRRPRRRERARSSRTRSTFCAADAPAADRSPSRLLRARRPSRACRARARRRGSRRRRRRVTATLRRLFALAGVPRARVALAVVLGALTVLLRGRPHGDRRLPDLARSGAAARARAAGRDRRRPVLRPRAAARALRRAARVARPRVPLARLECARASTSGWSRSRPPASPRSARVTCWPDSWGTSTPCRTCTCAVRCRRSSRWCRVRCRSRSRPRSFPVAGLLLAAGLLVAGVLVPAVAARLSRRAARRQAAARGELTSELVELFRGAPELVALGQEDERLQRVGTLDRELVAAGAPRRVRGRRGRGAHPARHRRYCRRRARRGGLRARARRPRPRARRDARPPRARVLRSRPAARAGGTRAGGDGRSRTPRARGNRPRAARRRPVRARAARRRPGDVALEDVRARYSEQEPPALDGFTLRLPPGRRVALVGASGAGKTTVTTAPALPRSRGGPRDARRP